MEEKTEKQVWKEELKKEIREKRKKLQKMKNNRRAYEQN